MISHIQKLMGGLSRITLMGSVAFPSALAVSAGFGLAATPIFTPAAEAAVIIGNRNKIKQKPRRNYKSIVRINRDLGDAESEISVSGTVQFFAPDGSPGPVRDVYLEPEEHSHLSMENPVFVEQDSGNNNILSMSVEGGSCGGTIANLEIPFESNSPVTFTLCETDFGSISGKASYTNAGKPRVIITVPSGASERTALYGRILIKGLPLELDRTVYTGDVNDVESGAVAGYTYEQTITVTDAFGTVLDTQSVRGIVGEDDVDVMGPSHIIIGNRNRIKERPRRNYKSVSVTQDNGGSYDPIFRIDGEFVYAYAVGPDEDGGLDIPSSIASAPSRVNAAYDFNDGPSAGNALSGGFCGRSFNVAITGVSEDDVIDDMGGAPIDGTELTIRANARLDGTLRVRVKGDYEAIELCEKDSLFLENTPLEPSNSFVNYIWESDIEADPRTFDGISYEHTGTLRGSGGAILDRFTDRITLDATDFPAPKAAGYSIYGSRNKIRKKPRRNYQGKAVSSGPSNGEREKVELHFVLGNVYDGIFREVGGDIFSTQIATFPATSAYQFEVPAMGGDTLQPDPWCGFEFNEPLILGQDTPLGDGVTATLSEANNGNYRVKVKGDGEKLLCGTTGHFKVNGTDAYDLGVTQTWTTTFPDLAPDLPSDQNFFLETRLVDAGTGEVLVSTVKGLTFEEPYEGPEPMVTYIEPADDFDWDALELDGFGEAIIAEQLPQDKPFALTASILDASGNVQSTTSNANACHVFSHSNITFADPDSVIDERYVVEITAINENGEESAFLEHMIDVSDGSTFELGEQIVGSLFETSAILKQNDDGETFELSVGLCGESQIISQVGVNLLAEDGGSDADPSDYFLEFESKFAFLNNTNSDQDTVDISSGAVIEVRLDIEGDEGIADIWTTSLSASPERNTDACIITGSVCHLRERPPLLDGYPSRLYEVLRRKAGKAAAK